MAKGPDYLSQHGDSIKKNRPRFTVSNDGTELRGVSNLAIEHPSGAEDIRTHLELVGRPKGTVNKVNAGKTEGVYGVSVVRVGKERIDRQVLLEPQQGKPVELLRAGKNFLEGTADEIAELEEMFAAPATPDLTPDQRREAAIDELYSLYTIPAASESSYEKQEEYTQKEAVKPSTRSVVEVQDEAGDNWMIGTELVPVEDDGSNVVYRTLVAKAKLPSTEGVKPSKLSPKNNNRIRPLQFDITMVDLVEDESKPVDGEPTYRTEEVPLARSGKPLLVDSALDKALVNYAVMAEFKADINAVGEKVVFERADETNIPQPDSIPEPTHSVDTNTSAEAVQNKGRRITRGEHRRRNGKINWIIS